MPKCAFPNRSRPPNAHRHKTRSYRAPCTHITSLTDLVLCVCGLQLGTGPTSARRWTRSLGAAGVRTARSGGAPRRPLRTPSTANATCTAAAAVQESLWKRSSSPHRYPSPRHRPASPPASRTTHCIRPSLAAVLAVVAARLARSAWGPLCSCTWTMPLLMRLLLVDGAKISGDV
jgi:hypothetical protein